MSGTDREPTDEGRSLDASEFGDEISAEARDAILALMDEIEALRVEIQANNQRIAELENLADTDPLTPVVNRRAFVREIDRTRAFIARYGGTASVIFFDVDGMKAINDRFGHMIGDRALLSVAEILQQNIRSSDLVGRLGGDEFGVLLARAGRGAAIEKAESLVRLIGAVHIDAGGQEIAISVCYGISEVKEGISAEAAITAADTEMYAQKTGRRADAC